MSLLRRTPSDLFNYIMWHRHIKNDKQYGSVLKFIVKHILLSNWYLSLHRSESVFTFMNRTPFVDRSDFCIRRNDWPHALEVGMVHLVAWTKTPINTDENGDPDTGSCEAITDFIHRAFSGHIQEGHVVEDNIQWFRNRAKWQSMRRL
ncbi:hypothetical protein N7478_011493 [Penicillium angulare]|uniref:uncharacterized protein n=1 Tax=Penicillium angulare TaxID=116970 RepID=UPI00254089BB|nr:uncharacterized protein N7478_011493 [Penicillium angulare]KAJ5263888.1 hypothetical protein N7478_011493 [Penicillium angulare]